VRTANGSRTQKGDKGWRPERSGKEQEVGGEMEEKKAKYGVL